MVLTLTLLVGVVLLSPVSQALGVRNSLERLVSRQDTGFDPSTLPSQCQNACSPLATALNSCSDTDPICICTNATALAMENCINCLISIAPNSTVITEAEGVLDDLASECDGSGLIPLTLSAVPSFTAATGGPSATVPLGSIFPSTGPLSPTTSSLSSALSVSASHSVSTSAGASSSSNSPSKGNGAVGTVLARTKHSLVMGVTSAALGAFLAFT